MHILVLARFQNDPTPSNIYVHRQAVAYQALGHRVDELSTVPWLPFGRLYAKRRHERLRCRKGTVLSDGVPLHYCKKLSLSNLFSQRVNGYLTYLAVKKTVRKLHQKEKIDVIHAHMLEQEGYAASLLKKKLGIPFVVTTHGTDCIRYVGEHTEPYLIRACKEASFVVAVSEKLSDVLSRHLRLTNLRVIYNGCDASDRSATQLLSGKEPYTLLSTGALIARKNMDLTLRAFAAVCGQFPQARLDIAGIGPLEPQLKELAATLQITDRVHFLGYVENAELLKLMEKRQLFVLPSVREGFGIVYLEAMMHACVPLATQGEGIGVLIKDGTNGMLVSPGDAQALSQAIARLFTDLEYCNTLALAAAQTAAPYTWENNAKAYLSLFSQTAPQP